MTTRFKRNSYCLFVVGLGLFLLLSGLFLTNASPESLLEKVGLTNKDIQAAGSRDDESPDITNTKTVEYSVVSKKDRIDDEFIEDWMDAESISKNYKTGLSQGMLVCIGEIDKFLSKLQDEVDHMKRSTVESKLSCKITELREYFKENPQFELHEELFTDLETIKKEGSRKKVKALIALLKADLTNMCTPGTTTEFLG